LQRRREVEKKLKIDVHSRKEGEMIGILGETEGEGNIRKYLFGRPRLKKKKWIKEHQDSPKERKIHRSGKHSENGQRGGNTTGAEG